MTESDKKNYPKTLHDAVERLLMELSQEDKDSLREMDENARGRLHLGLGMYIRNNMGLHEKGSELMRDCCPDEYKHKGFMLGFDPDDCSTIIIEALWNRLQEGEAA